MKRKRQKATVFRRYYPPFEDLYGVSVTEFINQRLLLSLHRALWNLYIVCSPTNALFIKPGKV